MPDDPTPDEGRDPDAAPTGPPTFTAPINVDGANQQYSILEGSAMGDLGVVKLAYIMAQSPMSTTIFALSEDTATIVRNELDRIFGPRKAGLEIVRGMPPGFPPR